MRQCFHEMLDHQKSELNKQDDQYISRKKRNTEDVWNVVEILSDTFINPFNDSHLVCISNGLVATEEVCEGLMKEKIYGDNAMTTFMMERLEGGATTDFFWAIEETGVEDVLKL